MVSFLSSRSAVNVESSALRPSCVWPPGAVRPRTVATPRPDRKRSLHAADLPAGRLGVGGVGHVHGRSHAEGRQQVGQRLDGLGLEHPLGHGVAQVLHDLVVGPATPLGPGRPPEHGRAVDQHDLAVGLVGRGGLEVDLAVGPEEGPGAGAGIERTAPEQPDHLARPPPRTPPGTGPPCPGSGGRGHPGSARPAGRSPRSGWPGTRSRANSRRAVSSRARRVSLDVGGPQAG